MDKISVLSAITMGNLKEVILAAIAALFCLTIHEVSHGIVAYHLGDPTAKNAGRLTLNPFRHIDLLGFAVMLIARVGWATPVPVDPRYFKKPKQGMAITAIAGPLSNFLLSWLLLVLSGIVYRLLFMTPFWLFQILYPLFIFLINAAVMSVGLGIFNLFPVPPLDGSKVYFSLLPDHAYDFLLRHERPGLFLMLAAICLGWLDRPLTFFITHITNALCVVSFFPYTMFPT